MRDPSVNGDAQVEESVIPFAPTQRGSGPNDGDQLDKAGQSILRLLHKAAGVAEENSRHALDMAQKTLPDPALDAEGVTRKRDRRA